MSICIGTFTSRYVNFTAVYNHLQANIDTIRWFKTIIFGFRYYSSWYALRHYTPYIIITVFGSKVVHEKEVIFQNFSADKKEISWTSESLMVITSDFYLYVFVLKTRKLYYIGTVYTLHLKTNSRQIDLTVSRV